MLITIPEPLSDEQQERLKVIAGKCPVHRALPGRSRSATGGARLTGDHETRLLIGGEQVAGTGSALEVENPYTEQTS